MRGRRSRRRARKARADLAGWLLTAALLSGVAAAGAAAYALKPKPIDPATLCAVGATPRLTVAILVDATDPLAPRHRRALEAAALEAAQGLAPGDRLSFYALRPQDGREPALLFSRCDPGGGADANPWFADVAAAQAAYAETFEKPLLSAMRRINPPAKGPEESPLIDALATVASDPAFTASRARTLVLASDLLEHRAEFSLYRDEALFSRWAASPDAAGRIAALRGAQVRVIPFDRPEAAARQAAAERDFWPAYFTAAGAQATFDP